MICKIQLTTLLIDFSHFFQWKENDWCIDDYNMQSLWNLMS